MKIDFDKDWRYIPIEAVFDADYAAFIKSLSRRKRTAEPTMSWPDLGPFAHTAYNLSRDLAGKYEHLRSKGNAPTLLPDIATPEGFYFEAVRCRREQASVTTPFFPTPFDRLGTLSRFLFQRMADRIARSAGFVKASSDGLGNVEDDGLGNVDDGLGTAAELIDDGL